MAAGVLADLGGGESRVGKETRFHRRLGGAFRAVEAFGTVAAEGFQHQTTVAQPWYKLV